MNQSIPFGKLLSFILIVYGALLLPILGRAALARIDEGQIAEVSREIGASGDWITPRIGGIPWAAYPPLPYWLIALSGSIFGFTEFAVRLPTAIAAIALLAVVASMARRLAGSEAGLMAAMCLATLPTYFIQSSCCRADVVTMLFSTAAFDRFLAWAEGGKRTRDLTLMYLFASLGVLSKGPLAVAVLGLGGIAWFWVHREWKLLLEMKFWIGIPAALALVIPWYWAVARINGWEFLRDNLISENLTAFAEGFQQRRPWYFYLKECPLLLPWLLILAFSWRFRRAPGTALSLAWFGLVALFFSISSAKRINYMTYFTPPLAIASGATITAMGTEAASVLKVSVLGFGGTLAGAAVIASLLPQAVWTGSDASKVSPQLPTLALSVAAAAVAIMGITWRWGPRSGCVATAAAILGGFFAYGFFINPTLSPENREVASFCRRVASHLPPGETLYVPERDKGIEGLFHFYVGATLPLRNGGPGYYLTSQPQPQVLAAQGETVQILDSMLDQRGRSRYFLRIHP